MHIGGDISKNLFSDKLRLHIQKPSDKVILMEKGNGIEQWSNDVSPKKTLFKGTIEMLRLSNNTITALQESGKFE